MGQVKQTGDLDAATIAVSLLRRIVAETPPALADETVHLASVLHVAGYRHVVATLWSVADRPALRVARAVYTDLASYHDIDRIPVALHQVTRALRDRYLDRPLAWAAYIHIGL